MIGTSRNPNLIAPAGTKNKAGGGGLGTSASLGASIEEIGGGINLNRTLGGITTQAHGNRYF